MYTLEMEAGCRTGLAEVSDTVEYCNIETLLGKASNETVSICCSRSR